MKDTDVVLAVLRTCCRGWERMVNARVVCNGLFWFRLGFVSVKTWFRSSLDLTENLFILSAVCIVFTWFRLGKDLADIWFIP